jgi:hypothetical protein
MPVRGSVEGDAGAARGEVGMCKGGGAWRGDCLIEKDRSNETQLEKLSFCMNVTSLFVSFLSGPDKLRSFSAIENSEVF